MKVQHCKNDLEAQTDGQTAKLLLPITNPNPNAYSKFRDTGPL